MSGPVSARSSPWQERLQDHCRSAQLHPPVFNIVSDRRGGRTAWSSTVTIPSPSSHSQQTLQARYWYDGQYVHNAKEDAAEVAWRTLTSPNAATSTGSRLSSSGSATSSSAYNGGMSGAMSPGGTYASTSWGAGAGGRQSQGQAAGGWPTSPRAGRWGSIGGP